MWILRILSLDESTLSRGTPSSTWASCLPSGGGVGDGLGEEAIAACGFFSLSLSPFFRFQDIRRSIDESMQLETKVNAR